MKSFQGALIDGKWSGKSSGKDIAVLNPGTGDTIGSVSACGKKDADSALVAAERAFLAWSKLGIDGRSKHILAFRYYQKNSENAELFNIRDFGMPSRQHRKD